MGYAAVQSLAARKGNRVISIREGHIEDLDLEAALKIVKPFPMDRYKILESTCNLRNPNL